MAVTKYDVAADLASFNNVDPHVVLAAVNAALSGDVTPIKSFGINLPVPTLGELARQTEQIRGDFGAPPGFDKRRLFKDDE